MTMIYDDISEESQNHLETRFWWIAGNGRFATIPEFPGTDCHWATIRILTSMLWNKDQGQPLGRTGLLLYSICPWEKCLKLFLPYLRLIATCLLRPRISRKEKKKPTAKYFAMKTENMPPSPCSKGTLSPRKQTHVVESLTWAQGCQGKDQNFFHINGPLPSNTYWWIKIQQGHKWAFWHFQSLGGKSINIKMIFT